MVLYCADCGQEIPKTNICSTSEIKDGKTIRKHHCENCFRERKRKRDQEFEEQGKRKGKILEEELKLWKDEIIGIVTL